MQPTRRYWETLALGGVLAAMALLVDRPILLVGAGGILAWLLATQLAFTRAIARLDETHMIEQGTDRRAVFVEEPATVTLSATGSAPGLDVEVHARPSAALAVDGESTISLGESTAFTVSSSIAGTHHLSPPELEVSDTAGFFTERFTRGPTTELTVETREPRRVHVGEGGKALPIAFGEHPVDATGSGIIPAELREYQEGEAASRIDWKATARLRTPHVREYQVESDVLTLLIVDHRESLQVGPPGETAFAYLRAAALGYLSIAESLNDPIGCYGLSGDGISRLQASTSTPSGYQRTRQQLRALQPTPGDTDQRPFTPLRHRETSIVSETTYGQTLQAYRELHPSRLSDTTTLHHAVRTTISNHSGTVRVALFTDDSDRASIRQAVNEAQRTDAQVFVFLAPRVLFEPGTLAELSRAVERYEEFERFRTSLSRLPSVTAYEVAPQDRLQTVLAEATIRPNQRH